MIHLVYFGIPDFYMRNSSVLVPVSKFEIEGYPSCPHRHRYIDLVYFMRIVLNEIKIYLLIAV